jgi:hypothetical protein
MRQPSPPASTSGIGSPPPARYPAKASASRRWFLRGSMVPTLSQKRPGATALNRSGRSPGMSSAAKKREHGWITRTRPAGKCGKMRR